MRTKDKFKANFARLFKQLCVKVLGWCEQAEAQDSEATKIFRERSQSLTND